MLVQEAEEGVQCLLPEKMDRIYFLEEGKGGTDQLVCMVDRIGEVDGELE